VKVHERHNRDNAVAEPVDYGIGEFADIALPRVADGFGIKQRMFHDARGGRQKFRVQPGRSPS
jgi:hypothetical protein